MTGPKLNAPKDFWNNRYSGEDYAYGTEPNQFFKNSLLNLRLQGKTLLPAEGEGRNAVFAAKQELDVTAFDLSEEGKKKAIKLAEVNHVHIKYLLGELDKLMLKPKSFDVIGLIFAHFPSNLKLKYHEKIIDLLKVNGIIIFEAFSKKHLEFNKINPKAGGPKDIDSLFSLDEIKKCFHGFEIIKLKEEKKVLNEGAYHIGKSSVIEFIGRKVQKNS
jgi:ubiquinone/menaquinone biosynthesis C-methylase UbiE